MTEKYRKWTKVFILIILLIIAAYDVFVFSNGGTEATISHVIMSWSYSHPAFTFAIGFTMGHLFWRIRKPPQLEETAK